jgi:hypothetical protein
MILIVYDYENDDYFNYNNNLIQFYTLYLAT